MRALCFAVLVATLGCTGRGRPEPQVVLTIEKPSSPSPPATSDPDPSAEADRDLECTAVVAEINYVVKLLEQMPGKEPTTTLEEMAAQLDIVARRLSALPLTLPRLREAARKYQAMATAAAAAQRALVAAVRANDAEARSAAGRALDAALKQEEPLVDRINQLCQAPAEPGR